MITILSRNSLPNRFVTCQRTVSTKFPDLTRKPIFRDRTNRPQVKRAKIREVAWHKTQRTSRHLVHALGNRGRVVAEQFEHGPIHEQSQPHRQRRWSNERRNAIVDLPLPPGVSRTIRDLREQLSSISSQLQIERTRR